MKKLLITLIMTAFALPAAFAQCDSLLSDSAVDQVLCVNEKKQFNFGVYAHRSGGTWSSPELGTFTGTTLTRSFTTSQSIIYTYSDPSKTCTAKDSFYLKVNPLPVVDIENLSDVCANEKCFSLTLQGSPFGGTWSGKPGSANYVDNGEFCPSKVNMKRDVLQSVWLYYTYLAPTTKCANMDSTIIRLRPVPYLKLKDSVQMTVKDSLLNLDDLVSPEGKKAASWSGTGVIKDTDGLWKFSADEVDNTKGFYELVYTFTRTTGAPPFCSVRDTIILELVDQVVSTKSPEKTTLQVFPNPSHGTLQIKDQSAFQYRIFDTTGKLIETSASLQNNVTIDLPKGMYWLSVVYKNGNTSAQSILVH